MAIYKNPIPIDRDTAIRTFATGSKSEICDALVAIAFYDADWKWTQDQCLRLLNHSDDDIRALAAICLGHIARIHGKLDSKIVISALTKLLSDKKIASSVQDALDDISMFLGNPTI